MLSGNRQAHTATKNMNIPLSITPLIGAVNDKNNNVELIVTNIRYFNLLGNTFF
jgi:hypothetical protein